MQTHTFTYISLSTKCDTVSVFNFKKKIFSLCEYHPVQTCLEFCP